MKRIGPLLVSLALICGCAEEDMSYSTTGPGRLTGSERYGMIYYLDGAGNLGYGVDTVPRGLRAAGFRGGFQPIIWTTFTGPVGDQMIRFNARLRSGELTKKIVRYRKSYPDAPLHVIGLSAGTGVATFALENLPADVKIDCLVLLGSSLSSTYNMAKALAHVRGKVYVIYSSQDAVLSGLVPVTGTIDGAYLVEAAGLIGLRAPAGLKPADAALYREKISNIPWRPSFERYGYAGGHTDATSYSFVKSYIAPRLLGIGATLPAPAAQAEAAVPDFGS